MLICAGSVVLSPIRQNGSLPREFLVTARNAQHRPASALIGRYALPLPSPQFAKVALMKADVGG